MAYTAEISRVNPSCFLFMIDQSGSMGDPFGGSDSGLSKAEELASVVNRSLSNLIIKCSKDNEVRRYFQVGVIGYGAGIGPVLGGNLLGQDLVWIDDIYSNPSRVEDRPRKVSDGAGGLVEVMTKFPVWLDPVASNGTPMCHAFSYAQSILNDWVAKHPASFPPVVIHVTDGESGDGDPSELADALRQLQTQDGNLLLLNLHLSSRRAPTIHFPSSTESLPDEYARLLFQMSSLLPEYMRNEARNSGYNVGDLARGFVFNADIKDVVTFFEIGTRPSNLR